MRLLLDSCVWGPAADELRSAGHDVECIADLGEDPGDDEVLDRSLRERRVRVALDKDFGEMVFVMGRPHGGILRLVGIRAREQGRAIRHALGVCEQELLAGAIVVAEPERIRIRRPEEGRG